MADVRFTSEYYSVAGTAWRIDIWDANYTGSATTFETAAEGAQIRYTAEARERHNPITTSECTFTFYIENTTHEALISDLAGAAENRFFVAVYKAGALQWAGVILTDAISYQDLYYPYPFEITATDGIAALKEIPYDNAGTVYTGPERVKGHVLNVLNKLPYVTTIYGAADEFLRTSIDWWDTNMPDPVASTDDPWHLSWIAHEAFYTFDKTNAETMSCYDVLADILKGWGARIYMVDGVFWAEQIHIRDASSFYARNYSYDGTQQSVDNATGDNSINQSDASKITGLQYEFFPALNRAEVTYKTLNRRNYLANYSLSSTNTTIDGYTKIDDNSGATTLRFSGKLEIYIKNDSYANTTTTTGWLLFRMRLQVGSYAAQRGYTVESFQFKPKTASWASDTGTQYVYIGIPISIPPNSIYIPPIFHSIPFEFATPSLSGSGDDWQLTFTLIDILNSAGSSISLANFTYTWEVPAAWLEVYSYGNPQTNEDEVFYRAENPTSGNTAVAKIETSIGAASNPNTLGRLQYGTSAAALVNTTTWGAGTDTRNKTFGSLLAVTVLDGQLTPIRKMLGQIRGTFLVWRRWFQDLDNTYWLMLGGTHITGTDTFNGEWFIIDYGASGVSVTPVKRRVNFFPENAPVSLFPSSNDGSGTTFEMVGNPPGTVLGPLANNFTSDGVALGTKTQIPVSDGPATNEYEAGDEIKIFDPVTGTYETLTISTNSTSGDTVLYVSGTLAYDYPAGAFIFKDPASNGNGIYGGSGTIEVSPTDTEAQISGTGSFSILYSGGTKALEIYNDAADSTQSYIQMQTPDATSGIVSMYQGTSLFESSSVGRYELSASGILIKDFRATKKGAEYGADYSANYTTRSLVDKAYVDAAVGATLPSGTDTQTLRYSGTTLTANSALTNDGTYIGVGGAPSTSYMIRAKAASSGKGIFAERDSASTGAHIYHDGSATLESVGGNNLKLSTASGSIIDVKPGGGGGQTGQVTITPNNNVTSTTGNGAMLRITGTYAPTASGGDFSGLNIQYAVNQTSAADQICRGININPTLTAVLGDFRGLAYQPSTHTFLYQANGTAVKNHLIGNLGIGTGTTSPSAKIDVVGNGATSSTYSAKLYNSTPEIVMSVRDDKRIGILTTSPSVTVDASTATDGVALPGGTTAQRPSVNNTIRYNSTVGGYEGRVNGVWYRLTSNQTPSASAGAAAGTSPGTPFVFGNDLGGQVSITTGTSCTTGTLMTVTWAQALDAGATITVMLTPKNQKAAEQYGRYYVGTSGNTSFVITVATALDDSTEYIFNYSVNQ